MPSDERQTYSLAEATDVATRALAYCDGTQAHHPHALLDLRTYAAAFLEILTTAPHDLERLGELADVLEEACERKGSYWPTLAGYVARYVDHHATARESAMPSVFVNVYITGSRRQVAFDKEELSVGRGPGNDIEIEDPNEWVSERHCLIRRLDDGFRVTDLGTTIGTSAGGRSLVGEDAVVPLGSEIEIGPATLILVEERVPASFAHLARKARRDGDPYLAARFFSEAIAELQRDGATAARLAPLHSALAHVCRRGGDLDGALAAARAGLALRQTLDDVPELIGSDWLMLARILTDRGELDEALDAANAARPYCVTSPREVSWVKRNIAERRERPSQTAPPSAAPSPPTFRAPAGRIFGVNRAAVLERARAAFHGDAILGVRVVEPLARPDDAKRTAFLVTLARRFSRKNVKELEETVLILHEDTTLITRRTYGPAASDLLEQVQWRIITKQQGRTAMVHDLLSTASATLIPADVPLSISNGETCWEDPLVGTVTLPRRRLEPHAVTGDDLLPLHDGDLLRGMHALFMFGWGAPK